MAVKKRKLPSVRKTTKLPEKFFKTLRQKKELFWDINYISTDKQFRELFYSPKTLNVTRDFIVYGSMPNSYTIINKRLNENPHAQLHYGKGVYKARVVFNQKTKKPVGFEIAMLPNTNMFGLMPIKWEDRSMRETVTLTERVHIARNLEQQIVKGSIDYDVGFKLLYGVEAITDWLELAHQQIEKTINIHARGAAIIDSPPTKIPEKSILEEWNDFQEVLPGSYINAKNGLYQVKVGKFREHVDHILQQYEQIDLMMKAVGASGHANNFLESYRNFRSNVVGLESTFFDDLETANETRRQLVVEYGKDVLNSLHTLKDKVLTARINSRTSRERLNIVNQIKRPPEIKSYHPVEKEIPYLNEELYKKDLFSTKESVKKWTRKRK